MSKQSCIVNKLVNYVSQTHSNILNIPIKLHQLMYIILICVFISRKIKLLNTNFESKS